MQQMNNRYKRIYNDIHCLGVNEPHPGDHIRTHFSTCKMAQFVLLFVSLALCLGFASATSNLIVSNEK